MLNILISIFVVTLFSTTTSNPTSNPSTTDSTFGITISLSYEHSESNITSSDTHKLQYILSDIIHDQINTIFDDNTISNCIGDFDNYITLKSITTHIIINIIITACNQDVENQLLILYGTNNTLADEFIDRLDTDTALILISDIYIDIDVIDSIIPNIQSTTTDLNTDTINNKQWILNVVYIGIAFVASCIVFIALFMCCLHQKKERKFQDSMSNLRKDLPFEHAPGLSRLRSLSSSPGSPPLSSADQLRMTTTMSQHYLVYGTEDITTLTPSPMSLEKQIENQVDFVQRSVKIHNKDEILAATMGNEAIEVIQNTNDDSGTVQNGTNAADDTGYDDRGIKIIYG